MVINVDNIPQLDPLTLAAVRDNSARLAMSNPATLTPDVAVEERLRSLGVAIGHVSTLSREGMPQNKLSEALITLAARALMWAEVADKTYVADEVQAAYMQTTDRLMRMGVHHQHKRNVPCAEHRHSYTSGGDTWLG